MSGDIECGSSMCVDGASQIFATIMVVVSESHAVDAPTACLDPWHRRMENAPVQDGALFPSGIGVASRRSIYTRPNPLAVPIAGRMSDRAGSLA